MKKITLSQKVLEALKQAQTNALTPKGLEDLKDALLDDIHTSYDPIQVLKDMLIENEEFFNTWQSAIASCFTGTITYNKVLDNMPITVLDERMVEGLASQAAASFLNQFSGKVKIEPESEEK